MFLIVVNLLVVNITLGKVNWMMKQQLQIINLQVIYKNSAASVTRWTWGGPPPHGFFERMVLTVIPQSFGADLDVLRSLWQHDDNFEKQSKSGSKANNSLKER